LDWRKATSIVEAIDLLFSIKKKGPLMKPEKLEFLIFSWLYLEFYRESTSLSCKISLMLKSTTVKGGVRCV
jgi:hypothetical protein